MRRSKSDPSKYARNYKVISQRRMTNHSVNNYNTEDGDEKDVNMTKLMLQKQTKQDMQKLLDEAAISQQNKRKSKKNKKNKKVNDFPDVNNETNSKIEGEKTTKESKIGNGNEDETIVPENIILLPPKKKKKKDDTKVELTAEELHMAKLQHKALKRKLQQLSNRSIEKDRRKQAYQSLAETALSTQQLSLLSSSSSLGKRQSKKQQLQKIWNKKQAGIALSKEELNLLITTKEIDEKEEGVTLILNSKTKQTPLPPNTKDKTGKSSKSSKSSSLTITTKRTDVHLNSNILDQKPSQQVIEEEYDELSNTHSDDEESKQKVGENRNMEDIKLEQKQNEIRVNDDDNKNTQESVKTQTETKPAASSGLSFAQQMMSGLADLKTKTNLENKEREKKKTDESNNNDTPDDPYSKQKTKYLPSSPIKIQTLTAEITTETDHNDTKPNFQKAKSQLMLKALPSVIRPADVIALRDSNALPIYSMEFEILDAIQSHYVTIICGETGSGKSTQVPQFLYEAGYSTSNHNHSDNSRPDGRDMPLLIGMTQPRRVAAIATAKRISYEMSCGNGQAIHKNNLVAYQTRYESAGLGRRTHIKVMTDGILLQEIQSDLLLRKYSVIVLDEAHERNLNTDVLLGLISKSIQLRRQVALEDGGETLPELKLVIMSATLRVQDFTENEKLFGNGGGVSNDDSSGIYRPTVVTVPGRTFPVSIHHSKVTELDDYEAEALKKIYKIHRKLPDGGILVFMTGKQEIDRMVKRLRKCFNCHSKKKKHTNESGESNLKSHDGPRDLDDDEIDSDLLQNNHEEDDYDILEKDDNDVMGIINSSCVEPLKSALVLPLHSLLSQSEQAKVFAPVPANHRLIVVSTNIAETSITIPNISYVVDTGRQKCLSHHSSTGVKSYNIMWISQASANQRAGRAGRTGPGHCYRLYSSSLFDRQMEKFAIPEILVRPLEDVILTMKNMGIQNILDFPFVTQPDKNQIMAALELLLNIGCLEHIPSKEDKDGNITNMGKAVSKIPLGVRYGKMLLIAAKCGILDYAIGLVAVLSESSPFAERFGSNETKEKDQNEDDDLDEIDRNNMEEQKRLESKSKKWLHTGGDVLAAVHALGAYTYAGRGAGGMSEVIACRRFCEENGLNFVIMQRIQKLRLQLAKMAQLKMNDMLDISGKNLQSIALKTGGILYDVAPPNVLQETLLRQAITSGLVDNIARLTPHGALANSGSTYNVRLSYQSCKSTFREPLFISSNSTLYSRDFRRLPEWVCYDSIIRKPLKNGGSVCTMQNVTPIDPSWLSFLSDKSNQSLSLGGALDTPKPFYDEKKDAIMCYVKTKYGCHSWEIPPLAVSMSEKSKDSSTLMLDDSYRWFARFLLEGKVIKDLSSLPELMNDSPIIITKRKPVSKCALLVSALSSANVDTLASLKEYWAKTDQKFLFRLMKSWVKKESAQEFKNLWMKVVKESIDLHKNGN